MSAPVGADAPPPDGRRYPSRPVVAVGAVIWTGAAVVLVRRAREPSKGEWSLPGGGVELGETLEDAIRREVREETALDVSVGPVVDVFDRIRRDRRDAVEYHYVLVDFLCFAASAEPVAGDDVSDVALAGPDDLARFGLAEKTLEVIRHGVALALATGASSAHARDVARRER